MGHVYYNALPLASQVEWEGIYREANKGLSVTVARWSDYAVKNSGEGFAEAYTAYMHKADMPGEFKEFFDDHFHGHRLVEAESKPLRQPRDDDVMITACGLGVFTSFVILRDGRKIVTHEPDAEHAAPEDDGG